eukprot:CAMPEP_0116051804 /NCGR_PEP_ID=MMETSP0322-20121206/1196_1 /TAXON_ID=163516 /ORGANISM="Leptocylindrus danicus var. apora, Strain B651" /LENGTH=331 /DNA_ID=CAMNT_0003534619 /DNA_START=517 /DNA_END=1512 /DNA_ORIENTATION=+
MGILDEFDRDYIVSQIERFKTDFYDSLESSMKSKNSFVSVEGRHDSKLSLGNREDKSCVSNEQAVPMAKNENLVSLPSQVMNEQQQRSIYPHIHSNNMQQYLPISPVNEASSVSKHQQQHPYYYQSTFHDAVSQLPPHYYHPHMNHLIHPTHPVQYAPIATPHSIPLLPQNSRSAPPIATRKRSFEAIEIAKVRNTSNMLDTEHHGVHQLGKRINRRSHIIVSTAKDLDLVIQEAEALFSKHCEAAKTTGQRVSWQIVASEMGLNVKVREKYARYHARAKARGFDFKNNGDFKIKDHPEIFIDPLTASDSEINSSDEYSSPDSAVLKKRKM